MRTSMYRISTENEYGFGNWLPFLENEKYKITWNTILFYLLVGSIFGQILRMWYSFLYKNILLIKTKPGHLHT